MLKLEFLLILFVLGFATIRAQNTRKTTDIDIDIPYQKFVLKNGLTLLVHEDRKAPIVAVNIWYHVGSKNEKTGKTGFAHLFEHLMFNGSENKDEDYFQVMESIGATNLNGTTNEDRTNYFQNVPASALDIALWMESDRMGHLLKAVTQEKLDEQRGVVQNEKRQYENEPYAVAEELIARAVFPAGHPYSWTVIGSMEDLNAASLNDVHEWFKTYYGPSNAVIVIAGDIDANAAKERVEKYFGDIPAGPPVAHHKEWIARRTGVQRQIVQDRVPQPKLIKVWNVPAWGSKTASHLDLVTDVLGQGKTSRLYKRLVYDDQTATRVDVYLDQREIAGLLFIEVMAKPGESLEKIEKAVDEELAKFIKDGPTEQEVERVKTQYIAGFVRGVERIGGFGGKSDILARCQTFKGDAGFYKTLLNTVKDAAAKDLHLAAKEWLSDGAYALEILPFPERSHEKSGADRSKLPTAGNAPAAKFPAMQKAALSNGLKIILAERKAVPVVNFNLMIDAGYAADQSASPGAMNLLMNMIDEGTKTRTALQISDELALLGSTLNTGADLDISSVNLTSLTTNIEKSLDIFADVILNPSFPENDFSRLQKQQLAAIQREKVTPIQMALRVFPQLLYGKNHAYGSPFTGSGNEQSVAKITRQDLMKMHENWFKPNNATLLIVGDVSLKEIQPKLEALFKNWRKGTSPKKSVAKVDHKAKSAVYLIDRPGSIQSIIFAGHVAPSSGDPDGIAIETMNNIFGGDFTSRLNMNLREDKHWTYGAGSFLPGARGQRPFIAYSPVQSDKTKEAMSEILKEMSEFTGSRPATQREFEKTQNNQILQLPGIWETNMAVMRSIYEIVNFEFPENYYDHYAQKVRNLKLADVHNASKKVLKPNQVVWVIVGDRSKIESGIKELNLGEIQFIDTDGNSVK